SDPQAMELEAAAGSFMEMEGVNTGDVAFLAISTALVFLMTPGLAFFYGGLVRASNILNTMMMSIISLGLISVLWLLLGFSLAFTGSFQYVGFQGLMDELWPGTSIPGLLFATFQMTFAVIAAAIISGALVERIRFAAFTLLICLWLFCVYVPLCNWIWAGGWIAQLGAKDFAGGTVVHISSGTSAFVAAALLGKRQHSRESMPNNVPFVILGGSLLWFGWMGFNGGSALAANPTAALAITTTFIAPAAAMLTWALVERLFCGSSSAVGAMSGVVAGLVAITPCAGFVTPLAALAVGAVGSISCFSATKLLERVSFQVDDSLGCFSLHGVGGLAGALLTGFFDTQEGVFYGGGFRLLGAQAASASFGVAFSGAVTAAIFLALRSVMRVRALDEHESEGLDLHMHSEVAYRSHSGRKNSKLNLDAEAPAEQVEVAVEVLFRESLGKQSEPE
ncbi:unnamed protein product, partial [Polarella glacialis]